jgi:two-component system response regulator FixJ
MGIVAIVDDNIAVLDSAKFLFGIQGFDVFTYSSAAAFLDDRVTRAACLIVDQNMPGMTGLELVARLRKEGSQIPVLLTTGLLSSDVVARAAELDIDTVLEKPLEVDDYLKFLNTHS